MNTSGAHSMQFTAPPTYCRECDNVHAESRKRVPSQWLCVKFKRLEGHGFVDPEKWSEMEPYMKCRDINGGACPLWVKRRDGQGDNGL